MRCDCGSTVFKIEVVYEFVPNAATSEWGQTSEVLASLICKQCMNCNKLFPEPMARHMSKDAATIAKQNLRNRILAGQLIPRG